VKLVAFDEFVAIGSRFAAFHLEQAAQNLIRGLDSSQACRRERS
jgi:hypothetical protein